MSFLNKSLALINCDMGEGMENDALIMPFINSANIACGYHAGNEMIMRTTIGLAIQHSVRIGAHPSFRDKENFGRTEMDLPSTEIYDIVSEQVNLLKEIAILMGAVMQHVKPHGALYNMSARDPKLANTIARAIKDVDHSLILVGLSGSVSISEAKALGLKTESEVFADRTYQDDGSLSSRKEPNAFIETEAGCIEHVRQMIEEGMVTTVSGKKIPIVADTICIHGDGENAVRFARALHQKLSVISSIKNS
jgi:5-oxoprolinase (ATP-hydrolysing) subunit A